MYEKLFNLLQKLLPVLKVFILYCIQGYFLCLKKDNLRHWDLHSLKFYADKEDRRGENKMWANISQYTVYIPERGKSGRGVFLCIQILKEMITII